MLTLIGRRVLTFVPIFFGITMLGYLIINLAPGNPLESMLAESPNLSAELIELRKEQLGLNDPVWMQYLHWLGNVLQGNLGYSLSNGEPVLKLIGQRIWPTISLTISAFALGILISLPLGVLSAIRKGGALDYLTAGLTYTSISVPRFFFGLVLIYIFAVWLGVLPSGGMKAIGVEQSWLEQLKYFVLPSLVLALSDGVKKIRYVRASMLEVLGEDYLRTARAKGLRESVVVGKHALRNSLIPIITISGLEIRNMLGGIVIVEQIFKWPGIGMLTLSALTSRDYPTLMGILMLSAVMIMIVNLLVDIVYTISDPRIKYS